MQQTQRRLNNGGLPKIVKEIVEQKHPTMSELADELDISKIKLSGVLSYLRKKGYEIHPIGSKTGNFGNGKSQEGILVDIMTKKSYWEENNQRQQNQYTNPHILASFRTIEAAYIEWPETKRLIESTIDELQIKILMEKQKIKNLLQEKNEPNPIDRDK